MSPGRRSRATATAAGGRDGRARTEDGSPEIKLASKEIELSVSLPGLEGADAQRLAPNATPCGTIDVQLTVV